MKFDLTINLGNLLTVVALIVGFWQAQRSALKELKKAHEENTIRLDRVESRLDIIFRWFERTYLNK